MALFVKFYFALVVLFVNLWYNVLMSNRYLSSEEKKIASCSRAGFLGASIRWANHTKVKTKLIRIKQDDYDFFSLLASHDGTITDAVSLAVSHCRCCGLFSHPLSIFDR